MKTREYRTIDKSAWADGPWHHEPDKRQWQDPETGLFCLIVRTPLSGGLCGYVAVPPEHPAHGLHYEGGTAEEAEARHEAYRENIRAWAKAGKPDLREWMKQCPLDDGPPNEPFPGIGELLAAIEVHGGLSYCGPQTTASREDWEALRETLKKYEADAERHPLGESARYRYEWLPFVDDYEGFAAKVRRTYVSVEVEPGEPDDLWFFGFDTGHAWDVSPAMDAMMEELKISARFAMNAELFPGGPKREYRDLAYVEQQVINLARQLQALTVRLDDTVTGAKRD
jgi:hypothetical protein